LEDSTASSLSASAADDEVKGMGRRGRRGQRPHPRATKLGGWLTTRAASKGASGLVGGDSDVKEGSAEEEEKLESKEVVCCSYSQRTRVTLSLHVATISVRV